MGGYAWVTLATNDSYSLGALVLAHSLKQSGTQQQLAVLVTPGVTNAMRDKLRQVFNVVQEVNILDSKDEANLRLLKRPELGITFTKLHCWRLTQFDKCVFLDADTLVLENCDELFEREELSAAPDVGWPDCFNSGVFVYRPSNETYEKLIQFALERGSFDGGDQGLLNLFFSDWAHKDISKHLPFIYNMCSTACYSYLPAFKQFGGNAKIIHFIGTTKPWLQYFDTETRKVHPSGEAQHVQQILQHWWDIFCSLIHPNLSPDMTSSHSDTVHCNQTYDVPQRNVPSNYFIYQHIPEPKIPNPAEDYQNVWDPWEEYDIKQSENQSNQSETIHLDNNPHLYQEQEYQIETFESHNQTVDHCIPHRNAETRNEPNHSFYVQESHIYAPYETQNHHMEHNQQNQLVESHNTNAYLAGHHDSRDYHQHDYDSHNSQHDCDSHKSHPPPPTYSQPQYHPVIEPVPQTFTHHEPPPQKRIIHEPPPIETSCPRLPDECVATTTVSNDITLNTGTNEDNNDNSSGLAGAFAQLTLGTPRTAEQTALDDHLRRQGWEVGNIDYLGRDSFDNIWSKICETLSGAPEPVTKSKDPSPPATSEVTAQEQPSAEVVSKPEPTTEVVPETPKVDVAQPAPKPEAPTPISLDTSAILQSTAPVQPASPPIPPSEAIPQPVPASDIITPGPQPAMAIPENSQTPLLISETPLTTPVVPESPQPAAVIDQTIQPAPITPETPQSAPIIPESSQSCPVISDPPLPVPIVPQSPAPTPVVLETSESAPVVSESPQSTPVVPKTSQTAPVVPENPQVTPVVPEMSQTASIVAESPQSAPGVPETPPPAPVVPESSEPTTVVLKATQPEPVIPESPQPAPIVPEIPHLASKAPESPIPVVPECSQPAAIPESPKPTTVVPESPQPAPETAPIISPPLTQALEQPQPAPVATQQEPAVPDTPKPTPIVSQSPQPEATTEVSSASPASPATTKAASKSSKVKGVTESPSPAESPKPESSPQVCPLATKPIGAEKAEKKTGAKKTPKETPQIPKSEVTEATPVTTPTSPSPKSGKQPALAVDSSVPDTPPPVSPEGSSTATPTPPPRKGSGAPKKTSTKPKK